MTTATATIKQLEDYIKVDYLLIEEAKKMIYLGDSTGDNEFYFKAYDLVPCKLHLDIIAEQLKTIKQEILLDNFPAGDLGSTLNKISKIESEASKIFLLRLDIAQVINCEKKLYLLTRKADIKEELGIWNKPNINDFSQPVQEAFNCIKDEKIPILLSANKVVDLTKLPHLLVAGQTGSGKSVFLNTTIISIISKHDPEDCKLALIDPKRVEFSLYKNVPHLWAPIATKLDNITELLDNLVTEMEKRYELLEQTGSKNIEAYIKQTNNKLPFIVVVIDELADLMMVSNHSVEDQITRLAQLSRAVGIHLIMATQRPVVEIMTGLIKANMPARISFKVASKQDSRVILDQNGAECLNGNGDMFFIQNGELERLQGVYVSESEIKKAANWTLPKQKN